MEKKPKKDFRTERLGFRVTVVERNLYDEVRKMLGEQQGRALSFPDMFSQLATEKLEQLRQFVDIAKNVSQDS